MFGIVAEVIKLQIRGWYSQIKVREITGFYWCYGDSG